MAQDPSPGTTPTDLATALVLGRTRHRGRPWGSPARALLAECGGSTCPKVSGTHFLVVDDRYGTPIHVFLELDPRSGTGFPNFPVRVVFLEPAAAPYAHGEAGVAIGQHPSEHHRFQTFRSSGAVTGAGFILIEPRYVGPDWSAYLVSFRPEGGKPARRPGQATRASTHKH